MKKILFFLFIANVCVAQTDSVGKKTDSLYLKDSTGEFIVFKDEVVVSATRASSNSPTTFQTISKDQLNKNNLGQDLPFLLDNTASVVTTSDAGAGIGYTGIRIRGSDATRINVTLNGVPVNDAESQQTYWVDLPDVVSSAQSIQLQRGVGSSTNGGSAFGGTLSVQTQTPSLKPFGEGSFSFGSFNTFRENIKAGTGLIKDRYFLEASGSMITSDGYIQRASSDLKSWFAQTGYMHGNTMLKFLYFGGRQKTYQAWNGVPQDSLATNRRFNDLGTDYGKHFPPYPNQIDKYGQDYLQLIFAQQLPKYLYLNLTAFTTLGRGYYEEYKADRDIADYFPALPFATTDLVRQKWLQNKFYGGVFSLSYEHKNLSATLGGLVSQYSGNHFGKVVWAQYVPDINHNLHYYDGKSLKEDFNIYAKVNYLLHQKVNLYADMQYRFVGYNTNGIDDDLSGYRADYNWQFVNPKFGLVYKMKPLHQIYASYALGNREPNRDDILAALASHKEIKPETMHNIESGYKFLHKNFPFVVNYYLMYYSNQLVLTGRLNDVGNPVKENVPVSYRTGLELNGSININSAKQQQKLFAINYSFTYSINKIRTFKEYIYTYDENYTPVDSLTQIITHDNTDISFSPNIIASLGLAYYPLKNFEISLQNKLVGKQYLDNTSSEDRMLKAFTYSNIHLSYRIPLKKESKEIVFTVLLNNVLNRLYESNGYTYSERYSYMENNELQITPVSTYNYYYPQAGFNFLAGIKVRF